MATHDLPPAAFFDRHPSSPPMTPGARNQIRSAPTTRHTSPISKRMGMSHLVHTPPLEFIEPIGHGHQFRFTRPQSLNLSSRPSSISGRVQPTTPEQSDDEYDSGEESEEEEVRPMRRADRAYFVLEELESDPGYDCDIEVVHPDHCEDAKSDVSSKMDKNEVYERLKELHLEQESSDDEEQERRYRQKKKRWSAGVFKRSHSQSVEGDSSYSDNDVLDDVNINARRLRRRVRGPCDRRMSLIFQDPGYANTNNILEVDEPIEGMVAHTRGPPSIPSDDAFTLDELPFWQGGSMDFEVESG